MKILIFGAAGYIGNPLRKHLKEKGHDVVGFDNFSRDKKVKYLGSDSITEWDKDDIIELDVTDYAQVKTRFEFYKPDAVVHLAEQPSAPWSMISAEHCTSTQKNNITGTLNILWAIKEVVPECHLVKIGTMGEFADAIYDEDIPIPESHRIDVRYNGHDWSIPTPHYGGSWYHWSKIHDTNNIDYANRIWGIRGTDIHQGIVFGNIVGTRLDYDYCFGTVINRFVAQAVLGRPLTIYGEGNQARSFINLKNSIQAITLLLESPPVGLRTVLQITEWYTPNQIAEKISALTGCAIEHVNNPRKEKEIHAFTADQQVLKTLGLKTVTLDEELPNLIEIVKNRKNFIKPEVIFPDTRALWR